MIVSPVKNRAEEEQGLLELEWEQVEQAPNQQALNRALAQASVEAYEEFLDSLFSYHKGVRPVEGKGGL